MSAVSVTCRRTLSRTRNLVSSALSVAGFLSGTAVLFAFNLSSAEGTRQSLSVLWAVSVAPFLPALSAFLSADVWSEERHSGRIDLLLSIAVRESELVYGKTLGVWFALLFATGLSLVSSLLLLSYFAPGCLTGVRLASFLPAFGVLALQAALWAASTVAVSAMFAHGFAAAMTSLALFAALPRGLWAALQLWAPGGRPAFGEMPLDAMVADVASGLLGTGPLATVAILTLLSFFIASKCVLLLRQVGRRSLRSRLSTHLTLLLSVLAAGSVTTLALRLDMPLDLQLGSSQAVSPRLGALFAEGSGRVTVTAFLSRKSPDFRSVAGYLRALKRQADAAGALALTVQYVDPEWDLGAAGRLVRLGVREEALVFEMGRHSVVLPLREGYGDRVVESALRSVALPPQHRDVYWTTGHGETAHDAYGPWGFSDVARELVRNGYRNASIDLSSDSPIPADCALIAVAGAKEPFSRAELNRIDAYLKTGGRLLVLMGPSVEGGVASLLPAWGVRPLANPLAGARTLSGSDVIVSDFSDHVLATGLTGSRLVLERPLSFVSSAAVQTGVGADRLDFLPVARVGAANVVAAVERGGSAGSDLAVRPTRIVVIGDPTFVANGQLNARGNANGDFFLNVIAYLSGTEIAQGPATGGEVLSPGMDRGTRLNHLLASALAVPTALFLVLMLAALRRRNRK